MFHGHIPLIMGTKLDLIAIGASKENSSRIWDWLCFEAYHLDAMLNRFVPDSEVSRVNKAKVMQNSTISQEPESQGIIGIVQEACLTSRKAEWKKFRWMRKIVSP